MSSLSPDQAKRTHCRQLTIVDFDRQGDGDGAQCVVAEQDEVVGFDADRGGVAVVDVVVEVGEEPLLMLD